ncbi:sirohydrochlorin cobaltochelatase [Methanococcus voltae]|uniref:sirohydrochlorin nickelochelatase n=1 Tax=Methanococcus voltae TaxID=2188 RepID=UPI001AEA8D78|nr:sirohydrochlorin nickelochelatase [Methanococcus voltae]MBP2143805.1 sirohydrochlorin cobaltochelatase [Methanococcus voltae]
MEALVLVGHGSKLPYSKQTVTEVADKIRAKGQYEVVEVGMMEFNHPTIPEAIQKVIDMGYKKIVVTPVFLAPGNHTERDIPTILGLLKEECHDENCDCHAHSHEHGHDHSHAHAHGHAHSHGDPMDIPEDVEIIYRKPMGADDRVIDIVLDRAKGL